MYRLIITIFVNALGLYVSARFIPGFTFTGTFVELGVAAALFAVINWFVRPLVKLLAGPLIVLTLGLFLVVVNMGMLWIIALATPTLFVAGITPLFWATLVIGVLNLAIVPRKR